MATERKLTGLGKRRQISAAGRAMFIWVAIASVIVSFSIVGGQFIWNQFVFNNKVIDANSKASDTLSKDKDNVAKLKDAIQALVADPNLSQSRSKVNDKEDNLQVVLDALPAKSDVTALSSSFQSILVPPSGVTLSSIGVPTDTGSTSDAPVTGDAVPLDISVVVTGTYASVEEFLHTLEKTIRPMNVQTMNIQGSDTALQASFVVRTYYLPTTTAASKINTKEVN